MNSTGALLKSILFCIMIVGVLAQADVQSFSSIAGFQLDSCSVKNKKCILVLASHAESGSMTPSMLLKNVTVKVIDNKTKKQEVFTKATGFYDVQNQRILLSELTPEKTLKETVFSIKDVSVQYMEMK